MSKFIVVHRQDENNVGDIASNPLQYFLEPDEYQVIDISKIHQTHYEAGVPLIVGGGGLLGNEFFGDAIQNLLLSNDKNQLLELYDKRWECSNPANKELSDEFATKFHTLVNEYLGKIEHDKAPKIIWGAGHNGEVTKKNRGLFSYPKYLAEFQLLGIRDYGQNVNWVPCASCMHPALQKTYSIKNDIIWFEHKKQLIKDFGSDSIPRYVNSGANIEHTIELLGSANIIITNSYHGAFWGTLLKKRVVVVQPWSTKFYGLKHQPAIADNISLWQESLQKAEVYNYALEECISVSTSYWNTVRQIC